MATPNVESFSMDQLASMPRAKLTELVSARSPIDIHLGGDRLRVRFSVINGDVRVEVLEVAAAGDGVLVTFANGCRNLARQGGIANIEWVVHTAACAPPNQRLQGVLTGRGFVLQEVPGVGQAYRRSESMN